jgi:hypothetical protein
MKHYLFIFLLLLAGSLVAQTPTVVGLTTTSGSNIKWYAASTGGSALATSTVLVNGTTYYASQTVNGVESATRLAVTATLHPCTPPVVNNTVWCCGSCYFITGTCAEQSAIEVWYNGALLGSVASTGTTWSLPLDLGGGTYPNLVLGNIVKAKATGVSGTMWSADVLVAAD